MTSRRWLSVAALGVGAALPLVGCKESTTPLDLSGTPAVVAIVSGNNQTELPGKTLGQPLVVVVTDGEGNPAPAVEIRWSVTGGTITPAIDSTDESGVASATWTMPTTSGTFSATANATGVGSVNFAAVSTSPATITPVSATSQVGVTGTSVPLSVTVRDPAGRLFPNTQVVWTATGGTITPAVSQTDQAGQSSVTWLLPTLPGRYTATATVAGIGSVTFNAEVRPLGSPLVFRYLDAGSYHSCGIATNENWYCWGYNGDGQLGPGLPAGGALEFPNLVPDLENFRLVTGGRYHSCGITFSGEVDCWGEGKDGRLGDETFATTFQYAQAGYVHTCGLSLAREVWCWGYNGDGELARPITILSSGIPCVLWGGTCGTAGPIDAPRYKAVTVNGVHSCAIRENGQADCWGFGADGQLGNGGTATLLLATPVTTSVAFQTDPTIAPPAPDPDFPLPDGPFIAAGFAHTCAITAAGPTHCWGLNEDGQLGNGNRTLSLTPVVVGGPVQFVRITSGHSHSCGITSVGAAYCWGDNTHGQIGDGTRSTPGSDNNDRLVPTLVTGNFTFAYIKAGELHTCGVTTTGVAYCWGDNEYGQLGDGTRNASLVPVKVAFQP